LFLLLICALSFKIIFILPTSHLVWASQPAGAQAVWRLDSLLSAQILKTQLLRFVLFRMSIHKITWKIQYTNVTYKFNLKTFSRVHIKIIFILPTSHLVWASQSTRLKPYEDQRDYLLSAQILKNKLLRFVLFWISIHKVTWNIQYTNPDK